LQESSSKEKKQQAEEIDGLRQKLQSQANKSKKDADSELEKLRVISKFIQKFT
jgi:hypothetical protein